MDWHEPPRIPLDQIKWEEVGEEDPKHRLLGQILIGSLPMHLEAREVVYGEDGLQTTLEYPEDHDKMCAVADCSFQTLEIDGREYFLFALPHGD